MRDFARALPVVLGGYALFDRAFAYVSVPGIPVYLGEALVGASVLIMIVATPVLRRRLPANLPQAILLLFICWGAARTVTKIGDYGVNSFRDASLWYYAILAFMVAALVTSPGTLEDSLVATTASSLGCWSGASAQLCWRSNSTRWCPAPTSRSSVTSRTTSQPMQRSRWRSCGWYRTDVHSVLASSSRRSPSSRS